MKTIIDHSLLKQIISMYGIQISNIIIPLITLPYLSRVLQPQAWGQLAAIQSFSGLLILLIDFGFAISAVRLIASNNNNMLMQRSIAAGVLGAKIILSLIAVLLSLFLYFFLPIFRETPSLFFWGVVWAITQSFNPFWYFQGVERIRTYAALDIISRAMTLPLIIFLVKNPNDSHLVFVIYSCSYFITVIYNHYRMYRIIGYKKPSIQEIHLALKDSVSLFFYRSSVALYTTANAFVLRLIVPAEGVAFYANADRLSGAAKGFISPISQILFPRVIKMLSSSKEKAYNLTAKSLCFLLVLSGFIMVLIFYTAPTMVILLFGKGYEPTADLIRVLALTLPLVSISGVLGLQWMLPLGLDKPFNTIVVSAGALNLSLGVILSVNIGIFGMAWSIVMTELYVALSMLVYLGKKGFLITRK